MTHIAITEHRDGSAVQWMEKVSDEHYNGSPVSPEEPERTPAQSEAKSEQQPQPTSQPQGTSRPSGALQQKIAPGLATLTDDVLFGDVWRRPELSPRDRSLVTISVLVATGKPAQLAGHLDRALDNGVQPSEASGLLAHLAVYCGWPSAVSAPEVDKASDARRARVRLRRDLSRHRDKAQWAAQKKSAANDGTHNQFSVTAECSAKHATAALQVIATGLPRRYSVRRAATGSMRAARRAGR